jgi:CDP-6-deoxy-D-xylo-4-hexulose-3-dehydrase
MTSRYSDSAVDESIVDDPRFKHIQKLVIELCADHHDYSFNPSSPRVRLHEPTFGATEINTALAKLLTTQVTMGEDNLGFEGSFAKRCGVHFGLTSNSGSSANLLAIAALSNPRTDYNLKAGDEVIVPALSWSTTVWPLIQHGLVPVIVDIDPSTLNIDVNAIREAITEKTKAVMIVHVYGNPCDMGAIQQIAVEHKLHLIEDCCEALGATYLGESVGSFGVLGTFSFYYSHHITTLEGGITVTNDIALDDTMRITRAHGWIRESNQKENYLQEFPGFDPKFLFVDHGYNLRITDVQAAIGLRQLEKLDGFVEQRRLNANQYGLVLDHYKGILSGQRETRGANSSWFGFPIIVNPDRANISEVRRGLMCKGIETRPIICGNIALQPAIKRWPHRINGSLEHATHVMKQGFSIGCHQGIAQDHIDHVAASLADLLE